MDMEQLRGKIDKVDREIVDRLHERVRFAAEIVQLKNERDEPRASGDRENAQSA